MKLDHIARELADVGGKVAAHRISRRLIGARRATKPEVDPPGEQRRERAELLGDLERRMVGQHDPARPDANRAGSARNIGQRHRGRRAGDPRHRMMLGHPEAAIAEALGSSCKVAGVAQRNAGIAAFGNRREIEDGQGDHREYMGSGTALCHASSASGDV